MSQRIYNRLVSKNSMQPSRNSYEPQMLGGVLSDYLQQQLGPKHAQWEALRQFWQELIPGHIDGHCSLTDFAEGRLVVAVDSPGYAHELRLLSGDLIKRIQRSLPQLKIKKITTVLR